jgi:DNA-binding response OmpR family regulator
MAEKILIVDDDLDTVEMLSTALGEAGYAVRSATNAAEGFQEAKEFTPDLVLLDLMLPDLNGYEFMERLRSRSSTAQIPIMVMTGLPGELPQVVAADAGADGYIRKPFQIPTLLGRVSAAMHAARWRAHYEAAHSVAA